MRNNLRQKKWALLLALWLGVMFSVPAQSAGPASSSTTASVANGQNPATKICQTISLITGVAISPLLGVSAVGAWEYFSTDNPEARARLPWYAQPLFFGPALLIVALCFIKDTSGMALPVPLKKPLDVLETAEHKISGLIATGAFVPIAAAIFESPHAPGASLSQLGLATIDLHWLYNGLMIPVAMAAFFIVFLASNAINILILLSPFPMVDAGLKLFRTAIIGTVLVSSWLNPWVGAVWALLLIFICYFVAGWSFRLSHFGLVYLWDFFTIRRSRFSPGAGGNAVFLGRPQQKVPARTYGWVMLDEAGQLILRYRPWLVLPERILRLPPGQHAVGRGLFNSEIIELNANGAKTVFLLPPRYRTHETELLSLYQLVEVRPIGFLAMGVWLKNRFQRNRAPA
jgi:hypothetical protein